QTTHPATAEGLREVDLFGDQVPLNANGLQFIPAGTNRLQKSQQAYIYAQIYEPPPSVSDRKDDSGVDVQLTVLDAKTGELVKDAGSTKVKRETAGTAVVPLAIAIPTSVLAPGSYTAQVIA